MENKGRDSRFIEFDERPNKPETLEGRVFQMLERHAEEVLFSSSPLAVRQAAKDALTDAIGWTRRIIQGLVTDRRFRRRITDEKLSQLVREHFERAAIGTDANGEQRGK